MTDNPLADIEAEHGFIFGTPDDYETADAPADKVLICASQDCAQQNRQVALHADTILPIFCGSCGQVLHCEHDWETVVTTTGTLANPTRKTQDTCTICATQKPAVHTPLPPINITDLPITVIASLLNSPPE